MSNRMQSLILQQIEFQRKKYLYRKYISSFRPIVVASTGRSGSTMLFNCIVRSFIKNHCKISIKSKSGKILSSICSTYLDRLEELDEFSRAIYKTHDLWNSVFSNHAKYIFLHGDPLESAQSVEKKVNQDGEEWFAEHQRHLRALGSYNDLYNCDILNYSGQLKSWLIQKQNNVLCVAYEDIWSRINEISLFAGFDIEIPPYRERFKIGFQNEVNFELFSRLRKLRNDLTIGT